jgi:hypothetical protein
LELNKFSFAEVINTRNGGAVAGENEEEAGDDSKDGARQAFAKACEMWEIPAQSTPLQRTETAKSVAAMAASQKQEYTGSRKESSDEDPSVSVGRKHAEQEIWQQLQTKKEEKQWEEKCA